MVACLNAVGYETLEAPLRRDRRRLVTLMDYVRYEVNPAIQLEAIRITHALAERLPTLLDMLLPPTAPGAHHNDVHSSVGLGIAKYFPSGCASTAKSCVTPLIYFQHTQTPMIQDLLG